MESWVQRMERERQEREQKDGFLAEFRPARIRGPARRECNAYGTPSEKTENLNPDSPNFWERALFKRNR